MKGPPRGSGGALAMREGDSGAAKCGVSGGQGEFEEYRVVSCGWNRGGRA